VEKYDSLNSWAARAAVSSAVAASVGSLGIPRTASAADLYWDSDPNGNAAWKRGATDGAGIWSTASNAKNWTLAPATAGNMPWDPTYRAVFGDGNSRSQGGITTAAVTLSGPVTAAGILFARNATVPNADVAYTLSGSTLTLTGTVTTSLDGTINSSVGGVLTKDGTATLTLGGTNNYGATNILAGTLQVGSGGTTGTLGTGPVTNNGTLAINHSDTFAISQNISGSGTLSQAGNGTTILTGTNTYTGPTTVSGGTLLVNGSTVAGSAVSVASTATLGGTGTIGGSVTVNSGGTIAPGSAANTPGTLTIGSTTTFNSGSVLDIGIANASGDDTQAGSNWDFLDLSSVSGNFAVTLHSFNGIGGGAGIPANLPTYTAGTNLVYSWLIAHAANGFTLGNITIDQTQPGFVQSGVLWHEWSLSTSSDNKNLYVSYEYNAVPEATTLLLAGVGLMPLVLQRRSRRGARDTAVVC
jgi:autotransporter-associated beta strand protein